CSISSFPRSGIEIKLRFFLKSVFITLNGEKLFNKRKTPCGHLLTEETLKFKSRFYTVTSAEARRRRETCLG
ncbi:MAG: hypothetical protein QF741_03940, partial [Candidatus Peribacteraceae bacterium]|nr:hypothetical protein [Candidatus Peribacteraceae bacterium]